VINSDSLPESSAIGKLPKVRVGGGCSQHRRSMSKNGDDNNELVSKSVWRPW